MTTLNQSYAYDGPAPMQSGHTLLHNATDLKAIPILVTGETSPSKIRSGSISSMSTELEDDAIFRKRWKSTYGFVLACVHLSLGLGNIWRFPYIAYRHGGGSFVIAYLIITLIVIVPLFFLETSLGQFSSRGPLAIWVISPGFKGIGYAMLIISTLAAMYFNMINSYSVLYTFASLQENMPWEYCTSWWNTKDCVSIHFVRNSSPNISLELFEDTVLRPRPDLHLDSKGFLRHCVPSYPLHDINRTTFVPSRLRTHPKSSSASKLFGGNGQLQQFQERERMLQQRLDSEEIYKLAVAKDRYSEAANGRTNYLKPQAAPASASKTAKIDMVDKADDTAPKARRPVIKVDDDRSQMTTTQDSNASNNLLSLPETNDPHDEDFADEGARAAGNGVVGTFVPTLSTEQYLRVFLGDSKTSSIGLSWPLALCSLFVWLIVFGVLIKGHKFSGKVAYVACLYPFILFTIIFVRVQSLTGSRPGIIRFFMPDRRILTAEVWHDAVVQSFFSNYVCWGPIIMMASHNSFFTNLLRDSIVVPCINTVAALIAGSTVFALISYLSLNTCIPFEDMAPKDPSLIYVIYPVITSTFPLSPLWGFLVFATMSQLGINSQIFCVKTLITSIMDERIPHFTKPLRIIFYSVLVLFLVGLVFATKKGIYLIEFIDFETTAWSLITIAILECVIISWVYGSNHLLLDIRIILRHPLRPLWYMAWSYVTPLALIVIMIVSILDNRDIILPYPPKSFRKSGWVTAIAWTLSVLPLAMISGYFAYAVARIEPPLWRRKEGKSVKKKNPFSSSPTTAGEPSKHVLPEGSTKIAKNRFFKFFPLSPKHAISKQFTFVTPADGVTSSRKSRDRGTGKGRNATGSTTSTKSDTVVFKESTHHRHPSRSHSQRLYGSDKSAVAILGQSPVTNDGGDDGGADNVTTAAATTYGRRPYKLFFNKARNRLGIRKDIPSQLATVTFKERLLKCLRATPQWGPYTENHQLLQQIAFRIQRCNHQILNKAVHRKAREIIDLVNRSGSTNLCIKDLLFINPDAPVATNGEAHLENIEDVGAAKMKAPRKYSLFDGFKEVVFMELPKDLMTKIDEPGVYSFLQPLDIDIPSNMVLLPNAYSFPSQVANTSFPFSTRGANPQDNDPSRYFNYPRYMSQDFTPDFPKLYNPAAPDSGGPTTGPASTNENPSLIINKEGGGVGGVNRSNDQDVVPPPSHDAEGTAYSDKPKLFGMWNKLKLRALAHNTLLEQRLGSGQYWEGASEAHLSRRASANPSVPDSDEGRADASMTSRPGLVPTTHGRRRVSSENLGQSSQLTVTEPFGIVIREEEEGGIPNATQSTNTIVTSIIPSHSYPRDEGTGLAGEYGLDRLGVQKKGAISDYPVHRFLFQRPISTEVYRNVVKNGLERGEVDDPSGRQRISTDFLDPNLYPGDIPYRPPDWSIFGNGKGNQMDWMSQQPTILSSLDSSTKNAATRIGRVDGDSGRRRTINPTTSIWHEERSPAVKSVRSPSVDSGPSTPIVKSSDELRGKPSPPIGPHQRFVLDQVSPPPTSTSSHPFIPHRSKKGAKGLGKEREGKDPLEYELKPTDLQLLDEDEETNFQQGVGTPKS